jgi:hypothetical protein
VAFDSREQRAAALGFGLAFALTLPLPDGTTSVQDGMQLISWYRYDVEAPQGEPLRLVVEHGMTLALTMEHAVLRAPALTVAVLVAVGDTEV